MEKIGTINGKMVYRVRDKDEYILHSSLFSNNEDRYCIIQPTNTIICNNMVVGYLNCNNNVEWYEFPFVYWNNKKVEDAPITLPVGEEEIDEVDDILNSVWKKEVLE